MNEENFHFVAKADFIGKQGKTVQLFFNLRVFAFRRFVESGLVD